MLQMFQSTIRRMMGFMHAYCLFCETQRCAVIAGRLEREFGLRCISPRIIQRKWIKGKSTDVCHPMMPGYLFLYSEEPIVPSFRIEGIIRWLERDELHDADLAFAEALYRQGGVLGTIRLAEEGDKCRVADPLWQSFSGTIVKMDRGRKRCCVEFTFDKIKRTVWVGYEMVSLCDQALDSFSVPRF